MILKFKLNACWFQKIGLLFFVLLAFNSCNEVPKVTALFELVNNSGINFINKVADNDTINILNYRNFYNGGGVATGDINNDGLADVFFTANQGSNKLYLNKGNFKFKDISTTAGFVDKQQFSTGVVMVDINADGWLDIFVCNAGSMNNASLRSNQLFINNHDLTFNESAETFRLNDSGYTTQVSFFDYDMDGDLDMFKIDNSPIAINSLGYPKQRDVVAENWNVPNYLKGGGDHLYRNDNGKFIEVTQQTGIHGSLMSFGLGVTIGDVNGDNYPDVYVSNDFFERYYLYINQKNGTFKDELELRLNHNSYASMGADIGDINNDGAPEIFTTDMLPDNDYRLKTTLSFDDIDQFRLREKNGFFYQYLQNTLQLNDGKGNFKDIANYSGVNASEWSWGALMFDADNDGYNDLFVCNGIYRDLTNQDFLNFDANEIKERIVSSGKTNLTELVNKIPSIAVPNKMYRNLGNLKFADESVNWGFSKNSFSNGSAYVDLDNDGDLDLVVNNVNEPAFVYKNNADKNKNRFVGVILNSDSKNTFAIGSTIKLYVGKEVITREVMPSRGFQSSVDYKQTLGIGNNTIVDSLIIIWPNRTFTKTLSPKINQYLSFTQSAINTVKYQVVADSVNSIFNLEVNLFQKHEDDGYTDFYKERGIPQMLSHEGPKTAVADVNGDGLEDIYIGGTVAKVGQIYLQTTTGDFIQKKIDGFKSYQGFVDGAVLFFDCENDGDNDLLICSAGNIAMPYSREMQHRLFKNDGLGNFELSGKAFPPNKDNISTAIANDFDEDGDLDLFIGARCVSGQYGLNPSSHIYINEGKGKFIEMPYDKRKEIQNLGMVTDATWADIDGDKKAELVVVGDWMAPQIFKFQNDSFEKINTTLSSTKGWWQTVIAADINDDGKQDLILGNLGENFNLKPSSENPVKLYLKDFDNNGEVDKIITRSIDGKDKPLFMKSELESQMPFLKKKNLRNKVYALKSIQELFTNELLEKTNIRDVNYTSSCVAINNYNQKFTLVPLPVHAQLSSIKRILPLDVNNDNKIDLIVGGNEFGFQPQLGRLDAIKGLVLINKGNGNFLSLKKEQSGINVPGQTRDIVSISKKGNMSILFLINNEIPHLYSLKNKNLNFDK